jgi:hypothetical protein
MYALCSYSLGVVSVELHAHPDPFLALVHAGQHGGTRFVTEPPFLREGLDRTSDMCKASILCSLSPAKREYKLCIRIGSSTTYRAMELVSEI